CVSFRDRPGLVPHQLRSLRQLLPVLTASNAFYAERLRGAGLSGELASLEQFAKLPFTTKADLVEDQRQHPPFGSDLTFPLGQYSRFHQTSGTTGLPLRWLDTAESWQWS